MSYRPALDTIPPTVLGEQVRNPNADSNASLVDSQGGKNGGFYLVEADDNSDPAPEIFVRDSITGFEARLKFSSQVFSKLGY